MKIRDYIFWLVVGLMLAPAVHAQTPEQLFGAGNEGQLIRYTIRDYTSSETGSHSSNFTNFKLHTYPLAATGPIYRVNVQTTHTLLPEDDGVWMYQLSFNGTDVPDCGYKLQTVAPGGFLQGDLQVAVSFDVECTIPPDGLQELQVVNFTWNRTLVSGTPTPPTATVTSIVIDRVDFAITASEDDILNVEIAAFDLWFPYVVFMGLALWSMWNGYRLPGLAAALGVLGLFLETPFTIPGTTFMFIMFMWLEMLLKNRDLIKRE